MTRVRGGIDSSRDRADEARWVRSAACGGGGIRTHEGVETPYGISSAAH